MCTDDFLEGLFLCVRRYASAVRIVGYFRMVVDFVIIIIKNGIILLQ